MRPRVPSRGCPCGSSRTRPGCVLLIAALAGCATREAPFAGTPAPRHALLAEMARDAKAPALDPGHKAPLGPEASPISFERMARYPEPGWHIPRLIAFSPDHKLLTYLESESESEEMALFGLDVATGDTRVLVRAKDLTGTVSPPSREEELRRERQRKRIEGITSYRWAKSAQVMVLPVAGDVFVRRADGAIARITHTEEAEIDPELCGSGERVAFVRGSELISVDLASLRETQLTHGAPSGVTRGQSDFNGQEEFGEEHGFWWSPTCERIAFLEVDERNVAEVPVLGYRSHRPDLMMQRYPAAGQANPRVTVKLVELATKKTTTLALPSRGESYVARFRWAKDGKALFFEALSRDQKHLSLLRADARTGTVTEILSETSPTWIELADFALLKKAPRFLWVTGEDAHRHLELRDLATGKRSATLTSGDWDVERIAGVDETRGAALFIGTKDGPLERQLYRVPLGGGEIRRLTPEPGVHAVTLDPMSFDFADVHSAANRPPHAVVRKADGDLAATLPVKLDADFESLRIRAPELVELKSAGGESIYGALLEPRDKEPGRRYPVVINVYGGPGIQTVLNQWSPRLLWQHLADRGFAVFQLDNRGSSGRGPRFETATYQHLGEVELADQLAGLDYLEALPFVERGRAAIYGHSYGGFMAGLAMLKAPKRFKVGIAGSPATNWTLYDTGYTERYMRTPEENPAGYAASDLAALAPALEGKLFLLHALMDENVHFQNTAELIDALVAADKDFDLLVLPGERHGFRNPKAKEYVYRRIVDYLVRNL